MKYKQFAIEESMIRSKIDNRMPAYCKIRGEETSINKWSGKLQINYEYANFNTEGIEDYDYDIDSITLWCEGDDGCGGTDNYQVECPSLLIDLDNEEWIEYLQDVQENIRDANLELEYLTKKEKASKKAEKKKEDKANNIKLMKKLAEEFGYEIKEKK